MTQHLSDAETVAPVGRRRRRLTTLFVGGALVAITVMMALFAPLLAPFDPNAQTISARLLPPSALHWFGTDGFGRDLLSRVIYGARPTLLLVSLILLLTIPVGLLVGIMAGYLGGWTERVLMRITDIFLSLPNTVIALALVSILGPGLLNGALALALTSWPPFARQARAETLALRRSDYLAAARMQGITGLRLMFGHILPLCLPSAVVRAALSLGGIILSAAGLGFRHGRSAADRGMGLNGGGRQQGDFRSVVGGGRAGRRHSVRQRRLT